MEYSLDEELEKNWKNTKSIEIKLDSISPRKDD